MALKRSSGRRRGQGIEEAERRHHNTNVSASNTLTWHLRSVGGPPPAIQAVSAPTIPNANFKVFTGSSIGIHQISSSGHAHAVISHFGQLH